MRYLIITLISLALVSCKKNTDLPDAPGTTLSKVDRYWNSELIHTQTFTYDAQSKLIQSGYEGARYEFTYNAQGKLSMAMLIMPVQGNPNAVLYTAVYTHDMNGRIIKKTTVAGTSSHLDNRSYAYDNIGRLIADSLYYGNSVSKYVAYTYDNNDNIIKEEVFSWIASSSSFYYTGSATYQYDDKISPYHQIGSVLYYVNPQMEFLSRSNKVALTPNNTFKDRIYSNRYYSNDLLRTNYVRDPNWDSYERLEYSYTQP